jgi:hypothetical protein
MSKDNKKVQELKDKIFKAVEAGEIASLYVLEQEAYDTFDEDTLNAYYANILDMALENLTNILEENRVMDMSEVQDFATVRALYEYAMEHYHAGKVADASALFEVLSGITNDDDFSSALKFHWVASSEKISLEDFLEKIADVDATEKAGKFYISKFSKEAQKLLNSSKNSEE